MNRLLWPVALAAIAAPVSAQLKLAPAFGPHMVLQRQAEVPVFGRATPGARVEVRPSWPGAAVARTVAGADGRFRADLRTPDAGGPFTLLIASGNVVQRLEDVLVGEVWVCSGQSNMEWSVRRAARAEEEIAQADHPRIRLLTVPNVVSAAPREDFDAAWQVCSPSTIGDFSAVGYVFGRALERELDVPIGLISADWGGTPAESWASTAALRSFDDFAPAIAMVDRLASDPDAAAAEQARARAGWERRVDALDLGMPAPGRPLSWATPWVDDAGWDEVAVPAVWSATALADFDGVAWYRRTVEIPAAWAGTDLVLELGTIDDDDRTWFAGTEIGATNGWNVARRYVVPGRLVRGGATAIAIRAHDTSGEGGFRSDDGLPRIFPDGDEAHAIALAGPWKIRRSVAQAELPPPPRVASVGPHTPSALYNGMIAPLVPFALRGAIWYQGESNVGRAAQYERLFPAMIKSWRDAWGRGDFPFLYVQIAPFAYGNRGPDEPAELRDAQRKTLDALPNVGMAVTMDVGDPRDIHPRDKVPVGERLARWALAKTYGRDIAYSGPLFRAVRRDGDALRVSFDHADGLRTADGGAPSHFEVAGEDGVFRAAAATIDGDEIVVRAAEVREPVHVRYGFGSTDQPNLVNAAGLPASSFRGRT